MTTQKDVFLESEGDAWFRRNAAALQAFDGERDVVSRRVAAIESQQPLRVLEVGCGDGSRLSYLARKFGHQVAGIDPSQEAVNKATAAGVTALKGTADSIPFAAGAFDVVIFGFCLYLCDDKDLFQIAREGDRVLANPGWLLILDFEASAPVYRPYHHFAGLQSRKMDYKTLFSWHPSYTLASHEKFHHVTRQWTDDRNEWVSLACLRKSQQQ